MPGAPDLYALALKVNSPGDLENSVRYVASGCGTHLVCAEVRITYSRVIARGELADMIGSIESIQPQLCREPIVDRKVLADICIDVDITLKT